MAEVFISYTSADRDRAKALAEALAAQGWSVWWDRTIPPGRMFDEVIEEALDAAATLAAGPPPIETRGSWRDTTWGHVSEFVQYGDTFQYTASGVACRGRFRSAGTGSIRGTRVEITYRSTMPWEGRCTGTVSPTEPG